MTEIMPFPENNYETVLLDRPERGAFYYIYSYSERTSLKNAAASSLQRMASGSGMFTWNT